MRGCSILALALLPVAACGEGGMGMPGFAESKKTIDQALEKIKGFGFPQGKEIAHGDTIHYVVWNNPYSGRAAVQVFTYRFDAAGKKWLLRRSDQFEGSVGIALSLDRKAGQIVYRDGQGNERLRLDVREKEQGGKPPPDQERATSRGSENPEP